MIKFIYSIAVLSICSVCSANTLSVNQYNFFNEELYSLSYTTDSGDGASLFVRLIDSADKTTIETVDYTVGIPFAWYDSSDIYNDIPFASNFGSLSSIEIKKHSDFYLYSWAGEEYDSILSKPLISYDDTIVWGQFVISDNSIQLINSGTIINTPEPSVWILAVIGVFILMMKKYFSFKLLTGECR